MPKIYGNRCKPRFPRGTITISGEMSAVGEPRFAALSRLETQPGGCCVHGYRVSANLRPRRFSCPAGLGRRIVKLEPKEPFFSQGDPADSVFYLRQGRARVTVVSQAGKEAILPLSRRMTSWAKKHWLVSLVRLASATAVTECTALKIMRDEMIPVMQRARFL